MPLTFENHYIVGVVVFMVTLLFCKNLLECLQAFMQVWQSCASALCKDVFFASVCTTAELIRRFGKTYSIFNSRSSVCGQSFTWRTKVEF